MILPILAIAPSKQRGRGVFATEAIEAQTILEISPVLVFSMEDRKKAEETLLYNYIFEWGEGHELGALGLGYISIYNHSYQPNCSYQMDFDNELMTITAIHDIAVGEELFINYNADPEDQSPIWFEAE
ncbi:MAG: SET domain-containing protein-lysine N-methyltransferase [Bacteroidetes bacterium 24-39-8]|jgi:SET domain-containing protein|nr:MAG: SET domain-containing protein-lysine N-methyltransferase [Sphingobacteriia bacterium 35-40-5]OYZ48033.1 MAG: SET domain-containing protein-lysine N-methyltransferase [Bacteroidetes bacterium 24-39-8]OZA62412.1 MAG: SET domain-containing protein-lysine N-methyltransferase [Sphingobacteriia bacterium 39-39-8]HQR94031.1 SET domain-containing protein [Sediminibacterium sp.]HQS56197.1 SET domain-containing protein [Sediminibacterium sp.]